MQFSLKISKFDEFLRRTVVPIGSLFFAMRHLRKLN